LSRGQYSLLPLLYARSISRLAARAAISSRLS
jgi:hypothetical protein